MTNRFYPEWQSFSYKYRGREQDVFEDLARTLLRKELGIQVGLFQRINQKGNETQIIEKDDRIIGFQAKFFKDEIDEDNIIHSMRGAKMSNPQQTHYYIYCNLSFGEPKRRKNMKNTDPIPKKTLKEEKIDKVANELGLTIVWKLGKAILDEVNEIDWIYDVFFNVNGKLEHLIIEERQHTEIAFASIGYTCYYHGTPIHINRTQIIERLEAMLPSSLYVIYGEGGSGKTAILHEFLEKHRDEYPIYYRKASVLNVQSLAQIFHQGNLYTMEEFQNAYKDCPRKYFVIDSAEHFEEMKDETIIPSLIRMLISKGWCIVFTVRNVFLKDLLNFLSLNVKEKNVQKEPVKLLTDKELMSLSHKYGIQLPIDANLRDRLRNLFYLNLYTQYHDEIDTKVNDSAFLQFIWEKKIRGKNTRKGYIRENEFEAFIREKIKTGQVFVSPNKFISEDFYSLIEDEVIALDRINGLFITHDIFEEWGLYRIVEEMWKQKNTLNDFFAELGSTQTVRRTFRLWLKDKVKENVDAVKPLVKVAFTDQMPGLWKDEVLCAILTSNKASVLLKEVENQIMDNTDGFRDKVIWALRVGCQYVQELVRLDNFYWSRCVPIGSGWNYIIDILYQRRANLDIVPWLPVLHDWTKANFRSEATRKAGLMSLRFYRSKTFGHLRYHDVVKKQVCEIINHAAWEIRKELEELLAQCITDDKLYDDLPEFILHENFSALNIQKALPFIVSELCLHYWKLKEDDDGRYYRTLSSGEFFGIDDDCAAARNFPPGANQTPTYMLLISDEKVATDFIIRLLNECVEYYSKSEHSNSLIKVDIKDEDEIKNWQWHSATLWGMYRGMDTSPYTLQSVHMALELYLLNLSKEEKYEQCQQLLRRLLFECHSSSVSAVVASLVLAYPKQYWKEALILFRTIEFIEMDNQRVLHEQSLSSLYGIGYTLNPMVTNERLETCKQEFRKSTLETICLNYQYNGNQQELNEEQGKALIQTIYTILDEHRKRLKHGANQELLEILLSRMDRRRLKVLDTKEVGGGIQIQFETKLRAKAREKSEEALTKQQEMYKYLGLQNWSMAKMRGETLQVQTYGDNWSKAINDAKSLHEELSNGREPFIMDEYTPTWVAACLLKFYSEHMSQKELKWCKNVVDQKLNRFIRLTNAMDGTSACIHVVPRLIELYPEEKDKYFKILLKCMLAHDYGHSLSSRDCVTTAVHSFDLWTKEPEAMVNLVVKFINAIETDKRMSNLQALNGIVSLIPDSPDETIVQYTIHYLEQIPKMLEGDSSVVQAMFSVVGNLARMFLRVNNKKILDCLEYTKPIVMKSHLGDSFLTHIIIEADNRSIPDRFWMIWNSYRDLLPIMLRTNSSQLRTYLLNIQWNTGIKEWHCLRKEDLDFFSYMAENCGGSEMVLECVAKALTNIAHSYQTEGMEWLAKIIVYHQDDYWVSNNLQFYLEQVMMEYVYANKVQIRKNSVLHKQVRSILNYMVSLNSVVGFVLRDMVC